MDAVALRIHFHFHCPKKKVAADSFSRNSFPRVNYLLPSDNPLNNKCIRNRNRDFLCLPLTFASLFAFVCLLIYFGSLLKAAAVILITIYLFISYLRNGIVWSHDPPPPIVSLISYWQLARNQFHFCFPSHVPSLLGELLRHPQAGFGCKKGLNCVLPVALGTHSQRAGEEVLQVAVVETPLSMLKAVLLALTSVFAAHDKYATRLQEECVCECVCI